MVQSKASSEVVCGGGLADTAFLIADWFGKGDMITLVGLVHNNRYEKDGQKRSSIEVKVEEIHFSGGKKKQENTAPTDNGNPYAGTEDDPLF